MCVQGEQPERRICCPKPTRALPSAHPPPLRATILHRRCRLPRRPPTTASSSRTSASRTSASTSSEATWHRRARAAYATTRMLLCTRTRRTTPRNINALTRAERELNMWLFSNGPTHRSAPKRIWPLLSTKPWRTGQERISGNTFPLSYGNNTSYLHHCRPCWRRLPTQRPHPHTPLATHPVLPVQPTAAASRCVAHVRARTQTPHLRVSACNGMAGLAFRIWEVGRADIGDASAAMCKACRGHAVASAMHTIARCFVKCIVSKDMHAIVFGTKSYRGAASRCRLNAM